MCSDGDKTAEKDTNSLVHLHSCKLRKENDFNYLLHVGCDNNFKLVVSSSCSREIERYTMYIYNTCTNEGKRRKERERERERERK